MNMRFHIYRTSMEHRQGTKEYHLLFIGDRANNVALVVNRWGKKGSWGQLKVETGKFNEMMQSLDKKRREKEKNGYSETNDKTDSVELEDLKKKIGPQYWANLGQANIKHIAPDVSDDALTGVRDPIANDYKQRSDGSWEVIPKAPKPMPAAPEETFEERKERDPLFGMF